MDSTVTQPALIEPELIHLNSAIPWAVVVLGLGFLLLRALGMRPKYLEFLYADRHPATAWGAGLWWLWWCTMAIAYFMFKRGADQAYPILLLVLDLGDLALLGFVMAYCSGNKAFKTKRLILLPTIFVTILVFYGLNSFIFGERPTTFSLILISESAILASVATIMSGWAFLVRWGSLSAIVFFFITLGYSILQVPAYLHVFFFQPTVVRLLMQNTELTKFEEILKLEQMIDLNDVFLFLAGLKLLLAVFPIAFFLSTDGNTPKNFQEPKYFPHFEPGEKSSVHPKITKYLLKPFTVIGPVLLLLILKSTTPFFKQLWDKIF